MARKAQDLTTKKKIIRGMAETCTELLHVRGGTVGNVVVGIGGTLVSPPLFVGQVKRDVRDVNDCPEIDELIDIIQNGVLVNSTVTNLDPTRLVIIAVYECTWTLVWEKLFDDIRRNWILMFRGSASSMKGLRVVSLGAVVTHKEKIINDYSFDLQAARGEMGGLSEYTHRNKGRNASAGKHVQHYYRR